MKVFAEIVEYMRDGAVGPVLAVQVNVAHKIIE